MIIKTYDDKDFKSWKKFHVKHYKFDYILTDKKFVKWYINGFTGYKTQVCLNDTDMVGVWGALPCVLRVEKRYYSMCWFVNGMVDPVMRGQGIASKMIDNLIDSFDIVGIIEFTDGAYRLYDKFGFTFFDMKPMNRWFLPLSANIFSYTKTDLIDNFPVSWEGNILLYKPPLNIKKIDSFKGICFDEQMFSNEDQIKIQVVHDKKYLEWRFNSCPNIVYEKYGWFNNNILQGYIIVRHEHFKPDGFYASRIIDVAGDKGVVSYLLEHIIYVAKKRGDEFIDFGCIGSFYDDYLKQSKFYLVPVIVYSQIPVLSNPIGFRDNHEFICLFSRKFPELFDNVKWDELYFVRGDSDRDRAN